MSVIRTEGLCKSYGATQVLNDVDLEVGASRLIGFLGPNGAGKTTTIRILLGLISQSAGQVEIFGQSVATSGKQLRREIGYLPGDVRLYKHMRGRAFLDFMAHARGKNCSSEIQRLLGKFDLDASRRIGTYSTGMRQKLGLIQALMHSPKLLILDEPTSALDPLVRQHVFDELRAVVQSGRTVLFSSHTISEVEELCDEVVMLKDGRILTHEPIGQLKCRALKTVELKLVDGKAPAEPRIKNLEKTGEGFRFNWEGPVSGLVGWLASQDVDDVVIAKPDLNALFMNFYEGKES